MIGIEDGFSFAASLLPREPRAAADRLSPELRRQAEDFRLRAGFPATVLAGEREVPLGGPALTERDLRDVLERVSDYSYHAVADELRQGFLSYRGGIRVGVCGAAVGDGGILNFREFSAVSIRIPHLIRMEGPEYGFLRELRGRSVLLAAPPGRGKTTLLRELIRMESEGGSRVGVADERGELAAVWKGVPQFPLGPCTDVLSGAQKAEATMLLLRAMNPQVLAMDEISTEADAEALCRIAGCGVRILATVHGASVEALRGRTVFQRLLGAGIFQKAVVISGSGPRRYHVEEL